MSGKPIINYDPNLLKSVLLLILAVSGNFIGNTLGCKTQYYMTNNMFIKHLIILFVIYFTLDYSSNNDQNPVELIRNAFVIWVIYLLFTKQNITFTTLSALLFVGTYVIDTFITYNENKLKADNNVNPNRNYNPHTNHSNAVEKTDSLKNIRNYMFVGGVGSVVVGFLVYLFEKYKEYGKDFDIVKLLFGTVDCKSLQ